MIDSLEKKFQEIYDTVNRSLDYWMNTDNLMRELEIIEPQNLIYNDDELILYFKWKKKHERNLPRLHVGNHAHLIFDVNCLLCKSQHFYKFRKCIQCKHFRDSNSESHFIDKNGNKEFNNKTA